MITHIWQSTLFAGAAGLLTLLLHRNRARTRYWIWFTGLVKFLAPFGVLVSFGSHLTIPQWTPKAPAIAQPAISFVMGDVAQPAFTATPAAPRNTTDPAPAILLAFWACGFVAIATCWVRRWMRVHADVRLASKLPIDIGIPVVSSPVLCEPGVFGIFRPVLMLPDGMAEHLSKAEWEAILAHEICHVRCHDNLTAMVYMLVESVFWFHPLVWWMGTRLVAERERACDEEVLRLGSDPRIYAEGILKVCELYLESPLECVAGVTGSNLRQRIRGIMTHPGTIRMSLAKKLLLAAAGMMAVTLPLVVGGLHGQPARQTAVPPAFEVASIKRAPPLSVENVQAAAFHVGMNINDSRADYGFMSLADLIPYAYRVKRYQLAGPPWMNETRWDILAKIPAGQPAGRAPEMMQNLLAERFKLAIHRENREQSVYTLVIGTRALKIKESAAEEEAPSTPQPADNVRVDRNGGRGVISGGATGTVRMTMGPNGGVQMQMPKITMTALADMLMQFMDRPIVDATELKGNYQVTLDLPGDLMTGMPAAQKLTALLGLGSFGMVPDASGAAIFQAVKDLGLELKSRTAAAETIIVDHVEKTPTAN